MHYNLRLLKVRKNVCIQRKRLHSLRQGYPSFSPREEPSESVKASTNGPVPRTTAPNPVLYSSLPWA